MKHLKSLLIGLLCLVVTLPIIYTNNVYAANEGTPLVVVGWGDVFGATTSFTTTHTKTARFEHCAGEGGSGCTFGYQYAATYSDIIDISNYEYVIVNCNISGPGFSHLSTSVNLNVTDNDTSTSLFTNTTVGANISSLPIFSKDVDSIKINMTGHVVSNGHIRHTAGGTYTDIPMKPVPSYISVVGYGVSSPKFNNNSYVQSNGNLTPVKFRINIILFNTISCVFIRFDC